MSFATYAPLGVSLLAFCISVDAPPKAQNLSLLGSLLGAFGPIGDAYYGAIESVLFILSLGVGLSAAQLFRLPFANSQVATVLFFLSWTLVLPWVRASPEFPLPPTKAVELLVWLSACALAVAFLALNIERALVALRKAAAAAGSTVAIGWHVLLGVAAAVISFLAFATVLISAVLVFATSAAWAAVAVVLAVVSALLSRHWRLFLAAALAVLCAFVIVPRAVDVFHAFFGNRQVDSGEAGGPEVPASHIRFEVVNAICVVRWAQGSADEISGNIAGCFTPSSSDFVVVIGDATPSGPTELNRTLSLQRGLHLADALRRQGVAGQLYILSLGERPDALTARGEAHRIRMLIGRSTDNPTQEDFLTALKQEVRARGELSAGSTCELYDYNSTLTSVAGFEC
ncbi:MAG: hypothetical protein NT015_10635 [Alphaproteobacteria bacterium]|nr:hypothetical protein [Alphaproteobacteria bacterium]